MKAGYAVVGVAPDLGRKAPVGRRPRAMVNLIIEQGMGVCLRKTPPAGFLGRDRRSPKVAESVQRMRSGNLAGGHFVQTPRLRLRPASDHPRDPRPLCLGLMLHRFRQVAPERARRGGGGSTWIGFRGGAEWQPSLLPEWRFANGNLDTQRGCRGCR